MNAYQRIIIKLNIIEDLIRFHENWEDKMPKIILFYSNLLESIHVIKRYMKEANFDEYTYNLNEKTDALLNKAETYYNEQEGKKKDKCLKVIKLLHKYKNYYKKLLE
jgi:hypothetical protein